MMMTLRRIWWLATFLILGGCQATAPTLSSYESFAGSSGRGSRSAQHAGVDFGGKYGEPIIAAADGVVAFLFPSNSLCGFGVSLYHRDAFSTESGNTYTIYCHMNKIADFSTPFVSRGDIIGYVGTSGNAGNVPHVHFEVSEDGASHRDGDLESTRDPADYLVGCYDPAKEYPRSEFTLTKPLRCSTN